MLVILALGFDMAKSVQYCKLNAKFDCPLAGPQLNNPLSVHISTSFDSDPSRCISSILPHAFEVVILRLGSQPTVVVGNAENIRMIMNGLATRTWKKRLDTAWL